MFILDMYLLSFKHVTCLLLLAPNYNTPLPLLTSLHPQYTLALF